jgi:hypothetical protein
MPYILLYDSEALKGVIHTDIDEISYGLMLARISALRDSSSEMENACTKYRSHIRMFALDDLSAMYVV